MDWSEVSASLEVDESVREVDWIVPGYEAGMENIDDFAK